MRVVISMLLAGLTVWLVPFSLQEREAERLQAAETLPAEAPGRYEAFADMQARFGYQALLQGKVDAAKTFLTKAVAADVSAMGVWLRLAEAASQQGNPARAREMLQMVADLTPDVLRWQWSQAMLARDLGMTDLGTASLNRLVAAGREINDAFYLLETDAQSHTPTVLEKLIPENREPYLRWLMQWRRPEDAWLVWNSLPPERREDPTLRLSFIHFLIINDRMSLARDLWRPLADPSGITHPGFEGDLTQQGFDWRFGSRKGEWLIQQTGYPFRSGRQALEVHFSGQANSNFSRLYQYVPLAPGKRYCLTYWWKARQITTDQGPFMEVIGKGCKGLYQKGPMIVGTEDWTEVRMEFDVPQDCEAILLRLRRVPSRRFDNKIGGTLWLDDFSLQCLEGEKA
jgi:hypothetical protein